MNRFFRNCLALVLLSVYAASAEAEVVKYIDDAGRTHFVEGTDRVPENYRPQADSSSLPAISKVPGRSYEKLPEGRTYPSARNKVEIFVTSWCTYCRKLEDFLREKNVSFKEFDIEKDPEGKAIHQQLGGGGVPVIKIGSTVIRGFRPDEITQALGRM